ncbi:hypothetical protein E3O44_15120 [Cryobacterium algoricola]|uniref:Peptidylprolyl isomerase n=1 Tax=Cryobacterium algoricola TaxID=1259183 RepID=A0ABY2ICJ7_9MICO|nr:hypothetical protein [Cryobacterium algoricola]TFB84415.1 hypothetical protein E3O44_15120 [Cryobacterium algoricola]
MRSYPALISLGASAGLVAVCVVLALTGCSPAATRSPAAPAGCAQPGAASDAVAAPGAVGTVPEVSFTTPLTAADTERTVLTAGTGVPVQTGDYVEIGVAFYNGRTGAKIDARGFGPGTSGLDTGAPVGVNLAAPAGTLPAILKGVTCSTVGSRVAVVANPADAWGAKENVDLDLHANDNVVIVVDVLAAAATPPVATDVPATGAPDTNVG